MNDLTKKIKTGLKNNPESKKDELIRKAVAAITTAFFIFSGVPVPTSFANSHQTVMNELNQPVSTVTLEQANAAAPATRGSIPSGAAIPADNPLSSPTPESEPEDPEFRETIYILPSSQAERVADIDSLMELLASKGITRITRDQIEALKPAQTDRMHIWGAAYHVSQNGDQIAIAFSAVKEYGDTVMIKGVVPSWHPYSRSYFSNILYSASPDSDPVVIDRSACVAHMGFTADGLLAIEGETGGSSVYNSEGEVVAFANHVVELYPVPSGWTRAASNANYAFKIETTGNYSYLKLLDLKTNIEKTVRSLWSGGKNPVRFTGNHDISPDGSTFIYETTEAGYSNIVTLMRVGKPGYQQRLWGSLESISFENDSKIAVITIKDVSETFIVDLQTFDDLWTRTASNANFAFRVESVPHSSDPQQVLHLMDLRTGERREIARTHVANGSDISKVCDISPDGEYVIYETSGKYDIFYDSNAPFGRRCTVYVQSMNDPARTIKLGNYIRHGGYSSPGGELSLKSIQFEGDVVRITRENLGFKVEVLEGGSVKTVHNNPDLTTIIEVNLKTGVVHSSVPGWTRAASNANFAFQVEYDGSYSHLKLLDLRYNIVKTLYKAWGGGQYPVYVTGNYDVSPDGSTVIYETTQTGYGSGITLERVRNSEEKLYFRGSLESIRFENDGKIAVIAVKGVSEPIIVDLQTLKEGYPVPSGWTRAASNANYAFKIETTGNYSYLKLLDLKTNIEKTVRSLWSGGKNPVRFTGNHDISPDGSTFIYETTEAGYSNIVTLMRVGKPGYQQRLWGSLESISFENDSKIAVITIKDVSETFIVDLQTFDDLWTRTASNANFAFRVESVPHSSDPQQVLHLMDLRTGERREIARTHVANGSDISKVCDISPDGEYVIYETSGKYDIFYDSNAPFGRRCTVYVQSMNDPARTIKLGNYIRHGGYSSPGGELSLKSIQFEGDVVRITRENLGFKVEVLEGGSVKTVHNNPDLTTIIEVNLKTGVVHSSVPGWTRAASNANFAFQVEYDGSYSHLKLLDLRYNIVKTLYKAWGGGQYPVYVTGNYDVSPDGSTVIYETTQTGYGSGITLERVRNSEEKLYFRGSLESIRFENDGKIAVIAVKGVSEPIKVDLQTFKQLPPAIILQARHVRDVEVLSSTQQIYYLEQNGKNLVIVYNPKTRVYHQYTVPGFDPFTNNTTKSPHTLTVPEGGHYAVITMGDSSTVYIVPLRNIDGEFVRSVRVPGVVARDGVASLVWRSAGLADMVMKSGARYTLRVDSFGRSVITPLMPPVPSGWTRATSNANFAFRVQRVGSTERLHIMDLKTGTQKMLLSVGGTRSVSNAYDVSPDGTTVIYGTCSSSKKTANYTYVQRISDPSKKLVLSGTLRSVSYASNGKIAVLVLQKNNSSAITGAWVDLLRLTLLR